METKSSYTVQMTTLAAKDLYRIKFYLDGFDPSIFISMTEELEMIISNLKEQPFMFSKFKTYQNKQYRKANLKKYIVVYDIDVVNMIVYIDRVFHSLEDYAKKLF